MERIDFINAPDCKVNGRTCVRQKEVACVGIENRSTQPGEGERSNATGRRAEFVRDGVPVRAPRVAADPSADISLKRVPARRRAGVIADPP